MTDSRYRPRDFSAEPDLFGRALAMTWKALAAGESRATLRAAKMQHVYAVRIRERIRDEKSTLKAYASDAGTSYDRAAKMLRGEVIMRLEDIGMADVVLGNVSEMARAATQRREWESAAQP